MMVIDALITRATFVYSLAATCYSGTTAPILLSPQETNTYAISPDDPSRLSFTFVKSDSNNFHDDVSLQTYKKNIISFPKEPMYEMRKTASKIIREGVVEEIKKDPTISGPLLRLAFHDATTRQQIPITSATTANGNDEDKTMKKVTFVGGPNGSIPYELEWQENRALSRPLDLIYKLQAQAQGVTGRSSKANIISLADTIALAAAQAIASATNNKIYPKIRLGRVDATEADERMLREPIVENLGERSRVETTLPSAGLDSYGLQLYFANLGVFDDIEEWVALCGAHDLGRHVTLLNMTKPCLKNLTRECLEDAPVNIPFVTHDPDTLSNEYFKELLKWYEREVELGEVAFIPTDVNLVIDEKLRRYVVQFANDEDLFYNTFERAFLKLVNSSATSEEAF